MSDKLTVFVGYDEREDIAYEVCKYSILKHSPEVEVIPIKQDEMRADGIYTREPDDASTDFSLTRFLVPELMGFNGPALFMDCDILVTDDIWHLFHLFDPQYAVQVVPHHHTPHEILKMDGRKQTNYPRKNWSSVVLWNCGHPKNHNLTAGVVNEVNPSFLHRFEWLETHEIGHLPVTMNFLVEYYKKPLSAIPLLIHFTGGGPWMENYDCVDYGNMWRRYKEEMENEV